MMASVGAGVTLEGNVPMGAYVGTTGSADLLRSINNELHGSQFFNSTEDIYNRGRRMFVRNIIEPIYKAAVTVKNVIGSVMVEEKYIAITDEDKLRSIPTCMHMPIMQYEPIRKLFDEGRVFGFGYKCVPEGDPYGRMINNGTVENVLEAMDKDGNVEFVNVWKSTDPDLSYEELDAIEDTRQYLDKLLADTEYDPTDFDNLRG